MAKALKLQYFISDSKWDISAIKQKRLEIIQNQKTTASTKDGLVGIDDTGCPKPFAKNTQGAKWQHCGPLKREEICNVAVASAFVSQSKHFPIDIVPYLPAQEFKEGKDDPEFKDKIQIAIELFNNAIETLDISGVTFDSWYASTKFIEHIHDKEKVFFSEVKSNRNIFMYHPAKKTHCMIKPDTFYFDHFQLRSCLRQIRSGEHIDKIERYWNLCLIAWTLTYWIKQNAYLNKILETKPITFNEFKQAINSLLEFSATRELSKNKSLANNYFKIKSARTMKKLAA